MTFGGLGQNLFNPALVGRVFLLVSFPAQMTDWTRPQGFIGGGVDALSGATPLGLAKEGGVALSRALTIWTCSSSISEVLPASFRQLR